MARIKNNITKSGASLINERTRFYREQNRPVRQAYIPNGYNTDNLNIDMAFNDENTINFDNLKYSSFKKYFNVYPNERNTISEQQATPSTFPDLGINDLGITFENFEGSDDFYNNQAELLEKFLKKVNPVEEKLHGRKLGERLSSKPSGSGEVFVARPVAHGEAAAGGARSRALLDSLAKRDLAPGSARHVMAGGAS